MRQIVSNYSVITPLGRPPGLFPQGHSVAPKGMIFHILDDNLGEVEVLDIGFGSGGLGELVKSNPETRHWSVDGIDGWEINCANQELFGKGIYRNVWHGLAQEIPAERLRGYRIICLLDVIEHLPADSAKWLLRTLLTYMGEESYLFISTPLWFFPHDSQQAGDLEEHLIGVPASSMMALVPKMYSLADPLVGGFVLKKRSLDFVDLFQPTADKNFSLERGLAVAKAVGMQYRPGMLFEFD